ANADPKAALGLVDARTVAGDRSLGDELVEKSLAQWQRQARRWMKVLGESVTERHARMGDVAFLIEPDLKEGRGGLRDVTALRAAAAAVPVIPTDDMVVFEAAEVLVASRVELHRRTGKSADRLSLQEQEGVARALGKADADDLMRAVSSAARTISWASDDGWRRIQGWLAGPPGRVARTDRPLDTGIVLRDDEVVVESRADLSDGAILLRVAAASARAGAPISRSTLERLRDEAAGPGDPWPPGATDALVRLLAAGQGAVPAFEALDQYGLL